MLEVCSELTVVANTGDDIEVYGVHVSPDPDLVTYWLADEIDERGWGLRGDTWKVMEALEAAGRPHWFRLGDRDVAMCLVRTERLRAGDPLTEAHAAVVEAMGVGARVLPMSDQRVATWVGARGRTMPFQEFMIVERAEGPIEAVELRGLERARPSAAVLDAIARAGTIVIGPSNPVISIEPILALPGMREALRSAAAPVVAVSPFVGGRVAEGADRRVLPVCRHRAKRDGNCRRLWRCARRDRGGRGGARHALSRDRHADGDPRRADRAGDEDPRLCDEPLLLTARPGAVPR